MKVMVIIWELAWFQFYFIINFVVVFIFDQTCSSSSQYNTFSLNFTNKKTLNYTFLLPYDWIGSTWGFIIIKRFTILRY